MKYPIIEYYKGAYTLIDFELLENYEDLVKKIDENFIKRIQNLAKQVLEEFETRYKNPSFQWDEKRGLHSIVIGDGRGAYLNRDNNRWVFKNIDDSHHALAVFNIISLYLNRLQEYKK